jgi:hypothetical protein
MEAQNCLFEITALNIPLNRFRVSACVKEDGSVESGGSIFIEKKWGNMLSMLGETGDANPISYKKMRVHWKRVGFFKFFKAFRQFAASLIRQGTRNTWKSWGLLNHENKIVGVGTFGMFQEPNLINIEGIKVEKFEFNKNNGKVGAEVKFPHSLNNWKAPISICIVKKETLEIAPINYNYSLTTKNMAGGVIVELKLPKDVISNAKYYKAMLMAELKVKQTIDLN